MRRVIPKTTQISVQNSRIEKLTFIDQVIGNVYVQAARPSGSAAVASVRWRRALEVIVFYGYDSRIPRA